MGDMIHDDHTTLLEVAFEPKCTNLYTKHFLWMCVCVCVCVCKRESERVREREREREKERERVCVMVEG